MITLIENIREVMGWCPNANVNTMGARKSVQFDGIMVNAPDDGGELTCTSAGWLNKYRNRILLNSFIITVMAGYFLWGIYDSESFIRGLLFWLIVTPVTVIFEWDRLNKAASEVFKKVHMTKQNMLINYLPIFGFMIAGILVIGILATNNGIKFRNVSAIILGFIVISWVQYLEIIYWERKNQKMLIIKKTSFYAVDAKGDTNE